MKRITAGFSAYPGISYAVTRKLHLETGFNNLLYINYSNEKANGFLETQINMKQMGLVLAPA